MTHTKTVRAIRIQPGKKPEVIDLKADLESLQAEVDGYIEFFYPSEDGIVCIVNEEGKLLHLEPNRILYDEDGKAIDLIVGTLLIVGDGCGGDISDLTDEQIKSQIDYWSSPYADPKRLVR